MRQTKLDIRRLFAHVNIAYRIVSYRSEWFSWLASVQYSTIFSAPSCLQSFDAVVWATEKQSGPEKPAPIITAKVLFPVHSTRPGVTAENEHRK